MNIKKFNFSKDFQECLTPVKQTGDNSLENTSKYSGFSTNRGFSSRSKSPGHTTSKDLKTLLQEMDTLRQEMEDKLKLSQNFEGQNFENLPTENFEEFENTQKDRFLKENEYLFKISEIQSQNEEISRLINEENRKHENEKVKNI